MRAPPQPRDRAPSGIDIAATCPRRASIYPLPRPQSPPIRPHTPVCGSAGALPSSGHILYGPICRAFGAPGPPWQNTRQAPQPRRTCGGGPGGSGESRRCLRRGMRPQAPARSSSAVSSLPRDPDLLPPSGHNLRKTGTTPDL